MTTPEASEYLDDHELGHLCADLAVDLAAADPTDHEGDCSDPVCSLCRAEGWRSEVDLSNPAHHAETCPWRRARELVDAGHLRPRPPAAPLEPYVFGTIAEATYNGERIAVRYGTSPLGREWEVVTGDYLGHLPTADLENIVVMEPRR